MLKTTSEELACPREDLSVARKEELRKLLLDQVQTVLGLLTGEPLGGVESQRLTAGAWSSGLAPVRFKQSLELLLRLSVKTRMWCYILTPSSV